MVTKKIDVEKYIINLCGNPVGEGVKMHGLLVLRLAIDRDNGNLYIRSANLKEFAESLDGGKITHTNTRLKIKETNNHYIEVEDKFLGS